MNSPRSESTNDGARPSSPEAPFVEERIEEDGDLEEDLVERENPLLEDDDDDLEADMLAAAGSQSQQSDASGSQQRRRRRGRNMRTGAAAGDDDEEESEGEELFGENFERDYRPQPKLDVYDPDQLDDGNYSEMSLGDRIAAEATLAARDKAEGRLTGRMRRGLDLYDDGTSETSDVAAAAAAAAANADRKRRARARTAALFGEGFGEDAEDQLIESIENLEDTRGMSVREWVVQMAPKREIYNRFKNFLRTCTDEKGRNIFRDKIRVMSEDNRQSFEVDYHILAAAEQVLAYFLPDAPLEMLEIFNAAAKEVVLELFPDYGRISKEIYVRISELPLIEDIRALRQLHLNQLIRTHGVITSSTSILPQLSLVKYDCLKCHYVLGPFVQTQTEETRPGSCPECQSFGPFSLNMEETIYQNYQRVTVQEAPGKVTAGRIPRAKDAILLGK